MLCTEMYEMYEIFFEKGQVKFHFTLFRYDYAVFYIFMQ